MKFITSSSSTSASFPSFPSTVYDPALFSHPPPPPPPAIQVTPPAIEMNENDHKENEVNNKINQSENAINSGLLAPPPKLSYHEQKQLVSSIQGWAKDHGYAVAIRNSCNKGLCYIYGCDISGKYVSKNASMHTRKTNCPFSLSGNFSKKNGLWQVKIRNHEHNHPPSSDPTTHPIHR